MSRRWTVSGTVVRRHGAAQLLSRSGRDLGPWFLELTAVAEWLPSSTLVDGEIVIADKSGQADIAGVQQRLTLARKFIAEAVTTRPAILFIFDVLALAADQLAALRFGSGGSRSSDCSRLAILAPSE